MRKILLLGLLFLPLISFGANTLENVGIIPGNIWYSSYPLRGGVSVRIYTAVYNGSEQTVQGQVQFTDNGIQIAVAPFLINSGKLSEVSIDWVPNEGSHKVSANVIGVSTVAQNGTEQPATLATQVVANNTVQVAPPPPVSNTDGSILASSASAKDALGTLGSSANIIGNVANDSLGRAAEAIAGVLPDSIGKPVVGAVSNFNSFASDAAEKVNGARSSVKNTLASEAAAARADNKPASLSQTSAFASLLPVKWLKSAYDSITGAISNWVLGDLPNKVAVAKEGAGSGIMKPFQYLWYFILSILSFILTNLWIFWLIIIYVVYRVLRFAYRKIFKKDKYGYA
ncbi:MAG: hypothetical protein HZA95_03250 [Candidatus Vogelbacteria bacterium]|nr:hypothetical protein [Candidatus Vogelbacteria bacterium]